MLSVASATTRAERFAFLPLPELIGSGRGPWVDCAKGFLAALQILESDPRGSLAILSALAEAPVLHYLCWITAADPEPLVHATSDSAFRVLAEGALRTQRDDFVRALAFDLRTGDLGLETIEAYWTEHGPMILQSFLRLCVLAARASAGLDDEDEQTLWCHRALMASLIFDTPIPLEICALVEADRRPLELRPAAYRLAARLTRLDPPSFALA